MKKLFLLITFVSMSYSCSNDESKPEKSIEVINYSEIKLDAINNISKLNEKIDSKIALENEISKYFTMKEQSNSKQVKLTEQTNFKITLAPHYNIKEATFMLSFYQDLANSYDSEIFNLLNLKRKVLNKTSFTSNFKEEVNLLFDIIEKTTSKIYPILYRENTFYSRGTGFWSCMGREGKNISRGIAGGAIAGAIRGAYIGATVGTVTLPGIGSVTGAVGGAVFGATSGAVGGAGGALIWAAVDCSSYIKPQLQKFPEERLELSLEKIKFINSILDVPEKTSLTLILE